jgi:hypothetical protein
MSDNTEEPDLNKAYLSQLLESPNDWIEYFEEALCCLADAIGEDKDMNQYNYTEDEVEIPQNNNYQGYEDDYTVPQPDINYRRTYVDDRISKPKTVSNQYPDPASHKISAWQPNYSGNSSISSAISFQRPFPSIHYQQSTSISSPFRTNTNKTPTQSYRAKPLRAFDDRSIKPTPPVPTNPTISYVPQQPITYYQPYPTQYPSPQYQQYTYQPVMPPLTYATYPTPPPQVYNNPIHQSPIPTMAPFSSPNHTQDVPSPQRDQVIAQIDNIDQQFQNFPIPQTPMRAFPTLDQYPDPDVADYYVETTYNRQEEDNVSQLTTVSTVPNPMPEIVELQLSERPPAPLHLSTPQPPNAQSRSLLHCHQHIW